jgi:hypothetical protein
MFDGVGAGEQLQPMVLKPRPPRSRSTARPSSSPRRSARATPRRQQRVAPAVALILSGTNRRNSLHQATIAKISTPMNASSGTLPDQDAAKLDVPSVVRPNTR